MPELSLAFAVKGPWNARRLADALQAAGAVPPRIDVQVACDQMPDEPSQGIEILLCEGLSLFQLWGAAAIRCRSANVAILHAHAPPAPGWADAMLTALGSAEALCGPVEPGYLASDPRITGYLVEYCQFHKPVRIGLNEVPGNNLIVARSLLPAIEFLDSAGLFKTPLLSAHQIVPTWVPDAIVEHRRPFALIPFCRRRFRHGRSYGALRLKESGVPPRLLLIGITPLLPIVRVWRIIVHACRHSSLRAAAVRRLPAMLLAEFFWSVGELVGYVTGKAGDPALLD